MKNKWFYEEILQKAGDTVIASDIRPATKADITKSRTLHKQGKCPHTIIVDTEGWPYDVRNCAICGKGLGIV